MEHKAQNRIHQENRGVENDELEREPQRLFPDLLDIPLDNWVISEKEIEKRRFLVHAEREHDQRGCDIRRPRGFSAIFQHDRQEQYAAEHRRAVRRNRNQAAREHQGDGKRDHHAAKSNLAALFSAAGTILTRHHSIPLFPSKLFSIITQGRCKHN